MKVTCISHMIISVVCVITIMYVRPAMLCAETRPDDSIRDEVAFFMGLPSGLNNVDAETLRRWKTLLERGDAVVAVVEEMVVIPEDLSQPTINRIGRAVWILAAIKTRKADEILTRWFKEADRTVNKAVRRAEKAGSSPQEVIAAKARARAVADNLQSMILGQLEDHRIPALADEVAENLESYTLAVQVSGVQYLLDSASKNTRLDVIKSLKGKLESRESRLYKAPWLANILHEAELQASSATTVATNESHPDTHPTTTTRSMNTSDAVRGQVEASNPQERELAGPSSTLSWATVVVWAAVAAAVVIVAVIGVYYWRRK